MGKVVKFRGKNHLDVACQVSSRWLEFPRYSADVGGKEFIHIRVMTSGDSNDRQLCDLYVTRRDLEGALKYVQLHPKER